jgi:CheY-like chemotaxis protein
MFDRSNFSILVVEDNPAALYATARGLRSAGYSTVEAETGARALELAAFVSAVVLDVHLPDLHGLEVCRLLRTDEATGDLPIVMVSAIYTRDDHRKEGEKAGANAYMVPPVNPEVLAAKLDQLLGQAASR